MKTGPAARKRVTQRTAREGRALPKITSTDRGGPTSRSRAGGPTSRRSRTVKGKRHRGQRLRGGKTQIIAASAATEERAGVIRSEVARRSSIQKANKIHNAIRTVSIRIPRGSAARTINADEDTDPKHVDRRGRSGRKHEEIDGAVVTTQLHGRIAQQKPLEPQGHTGRHGAVGIRGGRPKGRGGARNVNDAKGKRGATHKPGEGG